MVSGGGRRRSPEAATCAAPGSLCGRGSWWYPETDPLDRSRFWSWSSPQSSAVCILATWGQVLSEAGPAESWQ